MKFELKSVLLFGLLVAPILACSLVVVYSQSVLARQISPPRQALIAYGFGNINSSWNESHTFDVARLDSHCCGEYIVQAPFSHEVGHYGPLGYYADGVCSSVYCGADPLDVERGWNSNIIPAWPAENTCLDAMLSTKVTF
ncbi:hypothetical protein [Aeromonas sp. MdU4]|uniref:hypothetical protein n=1 Tax=Aeromonas sp. MdU4 TaxID=3342819 RepID=UPI0035BA827B